MIIHFCIVIILFAENNIILVQLLDLESLVSTMRGDGDKQSGEFQTLHSELQESKEEVSELMRALEDLALNYDQKADALQGKINY